MDFEIVSDRLFKLLRTAMYAATNLLFRLSGEESLNHIDPGGARGSEMNMEARPFGQPSLDQSCLVSAVVVHNEVNIEFSGNGIVDGVEELSKLNGAVPAMAFPDDPTRFNIESGKQGGRSVSFVVMAAPPASSGRFGRRPFWCLESKDWAEI